jgi:peroxiredoxin
VRKTVIIMAAVAVMAATSGYFVAMIISPGRSPQSLTPAEIASAALADNQLEDIEGKRRPDFTLLDHAGEPVSAANFDDQVLLINFWATWCEPCTEEMPMLSELQGAYADRKVQIVGIALDDPQKATEFALELNIAYPVLTGTTDAILVGRQYGNRAGMLPYSVLVDRQGVVRWSYLGALDRAELEAQIQALL